MKTLVQVGPVFPLGVRARLGWNLAVPLAPRVSSTFAILVPILSEPSGVTLYRCFLYDLSDGGANLLWMGSVIGLDVTRALFILAL